MNYREYQLTIKEKRQVWFLTILITSLVAVLFYRSIWGGLLTPFFYRIIHQKVSLYGREKRDKALLEAFLNGIRSLNAALQAGLSMERAWKEVEKESCFQYGKESLFYQEVREINRSVELNVSLEKLFMEFANRTGMEDIMQFAEVLDYGKRVGGNWRKIIDATVYRMNEKYEVKQQIEVLVAEKKLEQQIMNILPLAILAFLQFSSWDYMQVMYHNPFGVIVMSLVLVVYLVAVFMSEKILDIKV